MLRLLTLGGLDLRTDDGAPVRAVLAQPRRTALLVYLALREPLGFHQRNALLPVFWPDADESRARNSLRNALHHLRTSLGPDVIVARGDDELGINPGALWCDAVAFERAAQAGRSGEALQHWRGPLLDGFLPGDLPEFGDWLDARRRSLLWQAADAARALAERARAAQNWPQAAGAARRWVEIAPHDEEAIRALLHALERAGQRGEALAGFDGWHQRFTRELDAAPSAETLDAVARLRATSPAARSPEAGARPHAADGAAATPAAATIATAIAPAPAATVPLSSSARPSPAAPATPEIAPSPPPRRAWSRARWTGAAAGVLAAAALVVTATVALRGTPSPAAPRASISTVAVLPFSYGGSADYRYLREAMVDLLSTRIGGTPGLRAVDSRSILARVDRSMSRDAAIDPEHGGEIAGAFGSSCFVLGSVVELRGRLSVSAAVYEAGAAGEPLAQTTMSGDVAQLFALADSASTRLARACATAARLETGVAAAGPSGDTRSVDALREFVRGEIAFNASRYDEAMAAYRRATELDSGYARAYVRLTFAANWVNDDRLVERGLAEARRSGRLGPDDRTLLTAWDAHLHGAPARAESLYTAYLRRHPEDAEAWTQLGEVRLHWGSSIGVPAADARDAFARALTLLPDHAGALTHLIRLEGKLDSAAAVRPLVQRLLALGPRAQEALEARAILALAEGDTLAIAAVARDMSAAVPNQATWMLSLVAAGIPDPGAVRELRRRVAFPLRQDEFGGLLLVGEVMAEAAAGRLRAASDRTTALSPSLPSVGLELRCLLAALPFATPDARRLTALRDSLRALPTAAVAADPLIAPNDRMAYFAARRPLLDGLLSLRLADTAAAEGAARQLDALAATHGPGPGRPDSAWAPRFARDFAALVRARLAVARGVPAAALAALGPPHPEPSAMLPLSLSYGQAFARLTRAEALHAAGRDEDALRWYGGFPDNTGYDLAFVAPARLAEAEIQARLGRVTEARRLYDRALHVWRDADPELQPAVRAVRAARDRLR